MVRALDLATQAARTGEVPVGAVLTFEAQIIAEAHNQVEAEGQATYHAELLALQAATTRLQRKALTGCTLWVTLEPCAMCAAAAAHARIDRLVFAASDPKSGGVLFGAQIFDQPTCHHRPEVISGVGAEPAETLLKTFFEALRKQGS